MEAKVEAIVVTGKARKSHITTVTIGFIVAVEIVTPFGGDRTYVNADIGLRHQGKRQRIEWDFPTLAEALAVVEKEFRITLTL